MDTKVYSGGLTIAPAQEAGFYVLPSTSGDGYLRQVEFAGSLDECLAFVAKKFRPRPIEFADATIDFQKIKPGELHVQFKDR